MPLRPGCVVVNTEKLNRIHGIESREFRLDGGRLEGGPVLSLEAGVITEAAMEHAAREGLVFATDPTSAWACTIGGNIAENAGGKDCVLWGTCIDNIVSFRIAMPSGSVWTVRRANHQLRKILPEDLVRFEVSDEAGALLRTVELRGSEIRKKGLWKDITNKALGGLPGVQKEGTDGVIGSAEFFLYRAYPCSRTLCLEFLRAELRRGQRGDPGDRPRHATTAHIMTRWRPSCHNQLDTKRRDLPDDHSTNERDLLTSKATKPKNTTDVPP